MATREVGFSWPSKEGRREIAGVQQMPDGRTVYVIQTEGERFGVLLPVDQLEREIARDEANVAFRAKQRAAADETSAAIAMRDASLDTFLSTFKPLPRSKAKNALRMQMSSNGLIAARFQHVERLVREGWRVDGAKIVGPDGRFLTQSDMTKTALDYARFLSGPKTNPTRRNPVRWFVGFGPRGARALPWSNGKPTLAEVNRDGNQYTVIEGPFSEEKARTRSRTLNAGDHIAPGVGLDNVQAKDLRDRRRNPTRRNHHLAVGQHVRREDGRAVGVVVEVGARDWYSVQWAPSRVESEVGHTLVPVARKNPSSKHRGYPYITTAGVYTLLVDPRNDGPGPLTFTGVGARKSLERFVDANLSARSGVGRMVANPKRRATTYPLAPRSRWYGDADYKARGGKLVSMSTGGFLSRVRSLELDDVARENIEDLKQHILAGGELDPLTIYADGKEDGRHRAYAAQELGIKTVPVLTFPKTNPKETDGYDDEGRTTAYNIAAKHEQAMEPYHAEAEMNRGGPADQARSAHSVAAKLWREVHGDVYAKYAERKGARKKAERASADAVKADAAHAVHREAILKFKAKFAARKNPSHKGHHIRAKGGYIGPFVVEPYGATFDTLPEAKAWVDQHVEEGKRDAVKFRRNGFVDSATSRLKAHVRKKLDQLAMVAPFVPELRPFVPVIERVRKSGVLTPEDAQILKQAASVAKGST